MSAAQRLHLLLNPTVRWLLLSVLSLPLSRAHALAPDAGAPELPVPETPAPAAGAEGGAGEPIPEPTAPPETSAPQTPATTAPATEPGVAPPEVAAEVGAKPEAGDMVVTAQRYEQDVQKTPVTVTAFSVRSMDQRCHELTRPQQIHSELAAASHQSTSRRQLGLGRVHPRHRHR
jgi:hypothetical protein